VSDLAPILQGFFRVKLMQHKDASPHTIASYRDTWRLLLHYAQQTTGTPPEKMRLAQLDHDLVTGFLHHLDTGRGNAARTRNNRLAAIHSMFRYAALHAPDDAEVIQRVLAIESARTGDTEIPWLTPEETAAILAAPDRGTWTGRRDHAMMTVLLATGLRVSEILGLARDDARIRPSGSHVRCTGKGRRERSTPLDPVSAAVLGEWLDRTSGQPADPLFPARGRVIRKLSRDGFQARLDKYQEIASQTQPSLAGKRLFPHLFRHTRAMNMDRRPRRQHHRALAGASGRVLDDEVPSRRPEAQRTSPRPHRSHRTATGPLPAQRHRSRLPRQPHCPGTRITAACIMPTSGSPRLPENVNIGMMPRSA